MEQLPKLDAVKLEELIDQFQVPITSAKKGKKGAMASAIVKHLNRDELENSNDQGEAELRQWDGELAKLLKSTVENVSPGDASSSHEPASTGEVAEVKTLRMLW